MWAQDYNLFFLPQPYPEHEQFVSGRWITLTQDGEEGLGGLDRHGEERAGVLALVWQADVTDSDCELLPRRSHQLDSVIPQSCITKGGRRWGSRRVKNNRLGEKSAAAINFRHSVIQTTLSRGRASAPCLQSFEMLVTRCEKHAADGGFTNPPPLTFAFRVVSVLFTVRRNTDDMAGCTEVCHKKNPSDIYWGNHSHSRYWFTLNWILIATVLSVTFLTLNSIRALYGINHSYIQLLSKRK